MESDAMPRSLAQKEMVEAVSGCVEDMKVELLRKLHWIMDPSKPRRFSMRAPPSPRGPVPRSPRAAPAAAAPAAPALPLLPPGAAGPGPRASPALQPHVQATEEGEEGIVLNVPDQLQQDHPKLRLHQAWKLEEKPKLKHEGSHSNSNSNSFLKGASFLSLGDSMRKSASLRSKEEPFRWYDRLTVSHRSHFCMIWDLWTSIAIAYDMAMTPMDAFALKVTPVLRTLERTSSLTWFVDMLLSFVRSYGKLNGTEERHLRSTALCYLRTWFAFDFSLCCLDLFILIAEDSSWIQYVSFLRAVRLVRLLRVLRVAKVKARIAVLAQLLHILQTQHITDRGFLMMNIAKSLLIITVINHFTACIWYAIATFVEDQNNWVVMHMSDPTRPDTLLYIYTTAYHWSITQLTPASCEIYPYSARERIFSIAVILFGLCIFSSFISSMAQQLNALHQLSRADRQRMQVLRRFISEHHMSVTLATAIVDFVRQKRGPMPQRPLKISDIEMFNSFPGVLLQKIRSEAYHFVMSKHHFFHYIYQYEREVFTKLCSSEIIFEQTVDRGHEIFAQGEEGEGMYFMCHGKLAYSVFFDEMGFDPTNSQDWMAINNRPEGSCSWVTTGPISEVSLWLHWFHCGSLLGDGVVSDLLFISAQPFREALKHTHLANDVRLYARLYALRALRAGKKGEEVDDLWHQEEIIEEISRLSLHGGLEMAMNNLSGDSLTPQRILRAWRQEAQAGKYERKYGSMTLPRRLVRFLRDCFMVSKK